ncbi:HesB/IscA family protein [Aspergillus puulaauensis]|uniref:Core domain-containing protein n=1 Tax=Aspergillus puulaauensis TaxID=1220207 RepID=A0A7R8AH87_9EURO|nr:uncharacterized protein APUU_10990S [Aspergillus puulaauensis]BCS18162.1 hypothetical protein APUU_10990S [Aspergillus puulaauensis]
MSRPVLSSAVRQISRPRPARATFSARSSPVPNPTPSFSASFCHSSYGTPTVPSAARQRNSRVRCAGDRTRASKTWLTAAQPRSAFSTSAPNSAPQVTQNPRAGEDGETLMVGISERAANRLRQITDPSSPSSTTKEENPYNHLRITVTSGGCHGFQYMMSLEPASKIDAEEDTIFEAEPLEDGGSAGGAKVVMDEPSLELLSGSTVDYTTELIGSQFKIVDNPRATSSCGCGTSFDVVD